MKKFTIVLNTTEVVVFRFNKIRLEAAWLKGEETVMSAAFEAKNREVFMEAVRRYMVMTLAMAGQDLDQRELEKIFKFIQMLMDWSDAKVDGLAEELTVGIDDYLQLVSSYGKEINEIRDAAQAEEEKEHAFQA